MLKIEKNKLLQALKNNSFKSDDKIVKDKIRLYGIEINDVPMCFDEISKEKYLTSKTLKRIDELISQATNDVKEINYTESNEGENNE